MLTSRYYEKGVPSTMCPLLNRLRFLLNLMATHLDSTSQQSPRVVYGGALRFGVKLYLLSTRDVRHVGGQIKY